MVLFINRTQKPVDVVKYNVYKNEFIIFITYHMSLFNHRKLWTEDEIVEIIKWYKYPNTVTKDILVNRLKRTEASIRNKRDNIKYLHVGGGYSNTGKATRIVYVMKFHLI